MKSELKRSSITVIFITAALIISTLVFFLLNSSTAWFADGDTVNANGMNVNFAVPKPIDVEVEIYEVMGMADGTLYFHRGAEYNLNSDANTGQILFPKYEMLNEVNRYLLLRVKISGGADKTMTLTANTKTKYFMDRNHLLLGGNGRGGTCQGGTCTLGEHTYDNCLSSIVSFAVIDNDSVTEETMPADATPAKPDSEVASYDAYSFALPTAMVSLAKEEEGGQMVMDATVDVAAGIAPSSNEAHYLYVLLAYNTVHTSRVYSENIGNPALSQADSNGIVFVSDIGFRMNINQETSSQ